jgi:hypothetical protein
MPPGPSMCSYKRVCKVDLGSPLQLGGKTFFHRENCGRPSETFYWPKLRLKIHKYIRSCTVCTISKLTIKNQGLYTPLPIPEKTWASISMDYMSGLSTTKHKNDCMFVVFDRFSKMAILTACKKTITMTNISKLLFEWVWVHFGIPQTIISDQDNRFLNTFWSSL